MKRNKNKTKVIRIVPEESDTPEKITPSSKIQDFAKPWAKYHVYCKFTFAGAPGGEKPWCMHTPLYSNSPDEEYKSLMLVMEPEDAETFGCQVGDAVVITVSPQDLQTCKEILIDAKNQEMLV